METSLLFKPEFVNPAILAAAAGNIPALETKCEGDSFFKEKVTFLYDGANRAFTAVGEGNTPEPADVISQSLFQSMLFMGADAAQAQLVIFQRKRVSTRASTDPWEKVWTKVVDAEVASLFENALYGSDGLYLIISRALISKEESKNFEDAIPNSGVPKEIIALHGIVKDLDEESETYDADYETAMSDLVRGYMHSHGSHTVLRSGSDRKYAAVAPDGTVLRKAKDGNPKLCGIAYGFRADGVRPAKKAKVVKPEPADETAPAPDATAEVPGEVDETPTAD